jgi:starvation-inducible outer membrane lipoprotein
VLLKCPDPNDNRYNQVTIPAQIKREFKQLKVHIYKACIESKEIQNLAIKFGGKSLKVEKSADLGWESIYQTFLIPISWPTSTLKLSFSFLS